jgi:hypothetical protein
MRWGFAGPLRAASSVSLCRARLQGAVSSLRCGPHQPLSVCARQSVAFRLALRGRQRANARELGFSEGGRAALARDRACLPSGREMFAMACWWVFSRRALAGCGRSCHHGGHIPHTPK